MQSISRTGLAGLGIALIVLLSACKSGDKKTEAGSDWVTATGRAPIVDNRLGRAKDDALADAKKEAVATKIGTLISGTTKTVDNIMESSSIKSQTDGFIETYRIVHAHPISDYEYEVKIQAKVKEGKLKESIASLAETAGYPRIMAIGKENYLSSQAEGQTRASVVVEASMSNAGFTMVDKSTMENIIAKNRAILRSSFQNGDKMKELGADSGAEVMILISSTLTDGGVMEGTAMHSMRADLEIKAVDLNNGRILSSQTSTAAYPHLNPGTGANKAIERAWKKIQDPFQNAILKGWEPNQSQMIAVTISGLDYNAVKDFRNLLLELRGVKDVYRRGVTGDSAVLDVQFQGNSFELLDRIMDASNGYEIQSKDVKKTSMVLQIRKK